MTVAPAPVPSGSAPLASLFGGTPVVVAECALPDQMPPIEPAEVAHVAQAVPPRRIEFATGRWCARRALRRLGVGSFVLHSGPDRAPVWPAGIVGSITHTRAVPGGYCGVAVARAGDVRALGVDAERADALKEEVWPAVLTDDERRWLDGQPERHQGATLIFSAKECFFKAQYPLSHRFLEFHDVAVDVDLGSSTFEARIIGDRPPGEALTRCRGRLAYVDDLVVTGIALGA